MAPIMRPPPCRGDETNPEDWSAAECFRVLARHRTAVLWITCLAGLSAAAISSIPSKVYRGRTAVEVEYPNESFLNLQSVYPTTTRGEGELPVQTQAELLRQDSLLLELASRVHLPMSAADPERVLANLRQNITIAPVRNTRIIQIICDAPEPRMAVDLANQFASLFVERSIRTGRADARQIYDALQKQIAQASQPVDQAMFGESNTARIAAAAYQSNIRVVFPAALPDRPYEPNIPFNIAIGTFGGLVIAVGFVMLREQQMDVLRVPGDAVGRLSLAELGAVPDHGDSSFPEALHNIVTSILASEAPGKTILVTSSLRGEGKTTISCHLGTALASIGRKTLLIDANLRNPRLHEMLGASNACGLSDLFDPGDELRDSSIDRMIEATGIPDLFLLPAGAQTDDAFRLLCSGRMGQLLDYVCDEFEFVLVDAPACLEFAEARSLARYAGGVVLITRAEHTVAKVARIAEELLQCDGSRLIGIVLNRWRAVS